MSAHRCAERTPCGRTNLSRHVALDFLSAVHYGKCRADGARWSIRKTFVILYHSLRTWGLGGISYIQQHLARLNAVLNCSRRKAQKRKVSNAAGVPLEANIPDLPPKDRLIGEAYQLRTSTLIIVGTLLAILYRCVAISVGHFNLLACTYCTLPLCLPSCRATNLAATPAVRPPTHLSITPAHLAHSWLALYSSCRRGSSVHFGDNWLTGDVLSCAGGALLAMSISFRGSNSREGVTTVG